MLVAVAAVGMVVCVWHRPWWPGMVAAAAVMMGGCVLAWREGGWTVRGVVWVAVVLRLLFFALPPRVTDDAYRYIWDGTLQVRGVSPYAHRPDDEALASRHDETIYKRMNSRGYYSVYPPVSQAGFAVGGLFYEGGGWWWSYYATKLVFAGCELGVVVLLAGMVRPERLLLYAWHPLVLLEGAGQGHTEAAAAVGLVTAVWAARRGRGVTGGVALALAGMTKLVPFVLVPMLVRRLGWRCLAAGVAVSVAVTLPYVGVGVEGLRHVIESLRLYVRSFEFNAGLYYAIKGLLYLWDGEDWSKTLGPAVSIGFLSLLPVLYLVDWWRRWPVDVGFRVMLGAHLVLATTVHPWYLLPMLALTPLSGRVLWHWHVLALGSLGTYLLYEGGPYMPFVVFGWGGWLLALLLGWGWRVEPRAKGVGGSNSADVGARVTDPPRIGR